MPKIKEIRELILMEYGSLSSFAAEIGMSRQQLSRYLKNPNEKFYAKVKKVFGLKPSESLNEFLGKKNTEQNEYEDNLRDLSDDKQMIYQLKKLLAEKDKVITAQERMMNQLSEIIDELKRKGKSNK